MPRKVRLKLAPAGQNSASSTATAKPERETGTVRRVLLLLSCLADNPGEPINALVRRLNLPRSTVYRLLAMLEANGFVVQDQEGLFFAGPELLRVAGRVSAEVPYSRLAMPLLRHLSDTFRETSILAIVSRDQLQMFYACTASPPDPMRYNIVLNRPEPLIWGATARALLAFLTPKEIDAAARRRDRSPVGNRPLVRSELMSALGEIRKQGFAVSHSHRTPDAVGVAVPFFDAFGEVVGDFGFLIPESRYSEARLGQYVGALREAADAMTKQLGGRHPTMSAGHPS